MRLFTAICFDDETKNALFSVEEAIKPKAKGKFSLKGNLHSTLVFIGETKREADICSALSEIEFGKFSVEFSKTGTFEEEIFWAGIKKSRTLSELQKIIFNKLSEIGIETDEREYVPHVTLIRKFRPGEDFSFEEANRLLPKTKVSVNRISLMLSSKVDKTVRYTEIFSKELL